MWGYNSGRSTGCTGISRTSRTGSSTTARSGPVSISTRLRSGTRFLATTSAAANGGERRRGTSFVSPTEASFVARLVDRITAAGVPVAEVGVITPYAAQVHCICDELHTQSGVPNGEAVTVDTIDAFQGSERTVILISLVRSNPDGQTGFLSRPADGPRRLNVAMTRAERLCVLVGDWTTLTDDSHDGDIKLYDKLASFLRDTGRMREFDAALL